MDRIIVMCAPNGARRSRSDHAALPITPAELADCAAGLVQASVSVLHLHVRDESGEHTLDPPRYRDAIDAIRERVGDRLILQVTTEAVGRYTPQQQMATVRALVPEAVSLALREICPDDSELDSAAEFFAWMKEQRVWPQYIVYSPDELARFDRLRHTGLFADERPFCLFVLGRYASSTAGDVAGLRAMLAAAGCDEFPWAACCFGGNEHEVMLAAASAGGHVRIGFENNLLHEDGSVAEDNVALVNRFTAALDTRICATADEVRECFVKRNEGR